MAEWGFRCYIDETGVDVIRDWHDNSSEEVRGRFYSRLRILRSLHASRWKREPYDTLDEDGAGLGEIRFDADRKAQRPLGFHIFKEKVFVIVLCATKKGDKWDPRNAITEAQKRKQEVLNDGKRARDLTWLHF